MIDNLDWDIEYSANDVSQYETPRNDHDCTTTLETSGKDVKTTLETSGKDMKTTLETSGKDVKTTLETSVKDQRFVHRNLDTPPELCQTS